MAIEQINYKSSGLSGIQGEIQRLYDRSLTALIVREAPYEHVIDEKGRSKVSLPWIEKNGLYVPDRSTELGGTKFMPDMPPHIDPHPKDRLKAQLTLKGSELARFILDVPEELLDETNELPNSDYSDCAERGLSVEEVSVGSGDVICFLGSSTLHQFISTATRESYISSYVPVVTV